MFTTQGLQLRIAVAVLLLGYASSSIAADDAERKTLAEILAQNLAAVQGANLRERIISTEKVIGIEEAGNLLTAHYRAEAGGTMRIDVFADGKRVFSEGKDTDGVWEWSGDAAAPVAIVHDGVGALEHGIEFNLFPLAHFARRGHRVEYVDEASARGQQYHVLKITFADGFETFRYVNVETGLVDIARDYRAFHPGVDPQKITLESRYDQWRQEDGPKYAGRARDYNADSGELLSTVTITSSRFDVPVADLNIERSYEPR